MGHNLGMGHDPGEYKQTNQLTERQPVEINHQSINHSTK